MRRREKTEYPRQQLYAYRGPSFNAIHSIQCEKSAIPSGHNYKTDLPVYINAGKNVHTPDEDTVTEYARVPDRDADRE